MFPFFELGFGTQQGGSYGALSRLSAGARNQDGAPDLQRVEEGAARDYAGFKKGRPAARGPRLNDTGQQPGALDAGSAVRSAVGVGRRLRLKCLPQGSGRTRRDESDGGIGTAVRLESPRAAPSP